MATPQHARTREAAAVALVLGAALAAPVALPTWSVSDSIPRTRETADAVAGTRLTTKQSIRLVVADATGNDADRVVYGALLVCALAVLAVGLLEAPNRFRYALVPGYDRVRIAARWLAVFPAFVLPLAGVGLDYIARLYARRSAGEAILVARATPASVNQMWRSVESDSWDPTRTSSVVGLREAVSGTGTVSRVSHGSDRETWMVKADARASLRVSGRVHRIEFEYASAPEVAGRGRALVALIAIVMCAVVPRRRMPTRSVARA